MKTPILLLALLAAAAAPLAAQTYTWDGGGTAGGTFNNSGMWSTATNWSSDVVPGASNTAVLGNVTAGDQVSGTTRIITYDAAAPVSLGGLQFQQTTAGQINELAITQNAVTILSNVTVGSTAGTSLMYLDVAAGTSATPSLVFSTAITGGTRLGLTIASGGIFELQNPGTASTVNANVTISGGAFNVERGLTSSSVNASNISGNLTMTGGTLTLGATPLAGGGLSTDNRFQVGGNVSISGGTIVQGPGSASVFFGGATNDISGLAANPTPGNFSLNANSITQTLNLGAITLTSVTLRAQNATSFNAVKTISSGTGTIGQIVLLEQTTGAMVTFALGSNLATTSSSGLVAANFSQNSAVTYVVDTSASGFVLDLTKNTAGFTPNLGANGTTMTTSWTLQGSGVIKATTFDLSQATATSVSGNVTLQATGPATGTTGPAINLSNAGGGTIASTSTFLYSGAAAVATPAVLTTTRSIGNLTVQNGALQLAQTTTATGTSVALNTGGSLDLHGNSLTASAAALTLSGTAGGGTIRNSTTTTSATPATLSAASMTFNPAGLLTYTLSTTDNTTNMLISLTGNFTKGTTGTGTYAFSFSGGLAGQVYDLVNYGTTTGTTSFATSDFTSSGTAGAFSFNTVNGTQQLDFTVAAVPEPAETSLLAGVVLLGALAFRFRRARRTGSAA